MRGSTVDIYPTGLDSSISSTSSDTTQPGLRSSTATSVQTVDSIKAAHMCLESLEVMDTVEPIRIMGIKCEARHSAAILYALLLLLFVLFQYALMGRIAFS